MELQTAWLDIFPDFIYQIVSLSFLLAYSGIFFISPIARILSISKKRSAFDKMSRQIAFLGLVLGWILIIGGRIWLYFNQKPDNQDSFLNFICELDWMFLSIGVLLSSIYYTLWKLLKNMPVLHVTVGMISAVINCFALIGILAACRFSHANSTPGKLPFESFLPLDWPNPLWITFLITIPLIFGMAAALTLCVIPLFRKKNDYGRDYYNKMSSWFSAWAKNSWSIIWIILLIPCGNLLWRTFTESGVQNSLLILQALSLLFWLLPIPLWVIVNKSRIPMRNAWLNYLAFLLAMCCIFIYYIELLSGDIALNSILLNMEQ